MTYMCHAAIVPELDRIAATDHIRRSRAIAMARRISLGTSL
jgi:hypothetical protein